MTVASASAISDPTTARMVEFIRSIGIAVDVAPLGEETFLPGIGIVAGRLVVDETRLLYPGDILHEAGHLALKTAEERAGVNGSAGDDPGEEMAAIAWTWAALRHLGLPPEVVFHPEGYRGASQSHIENFSEGRYFGVPLLQWWGLTLEPRPAAERGVPPFPHMLRWTRE